MYYYFTKRFHRMFCITLAANILIGCGSDSVDNQSSNKNAVDPRFATAEALVAHITSLTERDMPEFRAYYDLVYPETPAQEAWARFADEYILPKTEFDMEVFTRFEKETDSEIPPHAYWSTKNLQLIENDELRAKAVFDSKIRKDKEIYLIKIGDRWWVSGYTWEYHPAFDAERIGEAARTSIGLKTYIDQVIRHLREGAFPTVQAAREAYQIAISSHVAAGRGD